MKYFLLSTQKTNRIAKTSLMDFSNCLTTFVHSGSVNYWIRATLALCVKLIMLLECNYYHAIWTRILIYYLIYFVIYIMNYLSIL